MVTLRVRTILLPYLTTLTYHITSAKTVCSFPPLPYSLYHGASLTHTLAPALRQIFGVVVLLLGEWW